MALRPADRERGLTALNDARQTRRRAVVLGRVRMREVATRFWILTFIGLVVFGIVYYRYAQGRLADRKNALLAQQRAVAAGMGTQGFALRDKLEAWTLSLAQGAPPDRIAPHAMLDAIARGPGIFLRLPLVAAQDVESIRRAAPRSLHDGFTSCLFIGRAGDPTAGVACKQTSQCGPGELCNEWSVCAEPAQPFNLRLLYAALRVVEPGWVRNLEAVGDEFGVRALELDLEDAAKHEVPAAVELVRRSKYFTLVLDEPARAADDVPPDPAVEESPEERLQASDHFARVGIWDLEKGEALLTLKVEASARFLPLGSRTAVGSKVQRAQQRQANGCAVGTEAREALRTGQLPSERASGDVDEASSASEASTVAP